MGLFGEIAAIKSVLEPVINWFSGRFRKSNLKLEIGKGLPFEVTEPADANSHSFRGVRIKVTNMGDDDCSCLAKIVEMKRCDGSPYKNSFLPVALKTQHQKKQKRKSGQFNLRAGESKFIEVAYLDETDQSSEILLQYESEEYPNMIPRAAYSIKILVYGCGKPAEGDYRLYVDARGFLKIAEERKSA